MACAPRAPDAGIWQAISLEIILTFCLSVKEHRAAIFALRAFNAETALIGSQVKIDEATLIQVRFQWWRDALNAIAAGGRPPAHPVAQALAHVMATRRLNR